MDKRRDFIKIIFLKSYYYFYGVQKVASCRLYFFFCSIKIVTFARLKIMP